MRQTRLRQFFCSRPIRQLAVSLLACLLLNLVGLLFGPTALATDYNRAFLVGKDFSNRVLTDDEFTKANLRGADFSNSDLHGVRFFGTNLEDANLEGANLSFATLDSARLVNANLKNAVLEGAFAANVQMAGAEIEGADFTDVLLRDDTQEMLCRIATGTNPTTGRDTSESLGCRAAGLESCYNLFTLAIFQTTPVT